MKDATPKLLAAFSCRASSDLAVRPPRLFTVRRGLSQQLIPIEDALTLYAMHSIVLATE